MPLDETLENTLSSGIGVILEAISNALNQKNKYPWAQVKLPHNSVEFMCEVGIGETNSMENFFDAFSTVCQQLNIKLPPNNYCTKKTLRIEKKDFVKFEFHISPSEFHNILMHFSHYSGYHDKGSLLRLENPEKQVKKPGYICLFPVQDLEDGSFLMRNAGCNTTETIANQVAFYVKEILGNISFDACYGHHSNIVTDEILHIAPNTLLKIALESIGVKLEGPISIEGMEGTMVIENISQYVVNMSQDAYEIYRETSAVLSEELKLLKSVEVPVEYFFEQLIVWKQDEMNKIRAELEWLFEKISTDNNTYGNEFRRPSALIDSFYHQKYNAFYIDDEFLKTNQTLNEQYKILCNDARFFNSIIEKKIIPLLKLKEICETQPHLYSREIFILSKLIKYKHHYSDPQRQEFINEQKNTYLINCKKFLTDYASFRYESYVEELTLDIDLLTRIKSGLVPTKSLLTTENLKNTRTSRLHGPDFFTLSSSSDIKEDSKKPSVVVSKLSH